MPGMSQLMPGVSGPEPSKLTPGTRNPHRP
jgi:hypothetical protein